MYPYTHPQIYSMKLQLYWVWCSLTNHLIILTCEPNRRMVDCLSRKKIKDVPLGFYVSESWLSLFTAHNCTHNDPLCVVFTWIIVVCMSKYALRIAYAYVKTLTSMQWNRLGFSLRDLQDFKNCKWNTSCTIWIQSLSVYLRKCQHVMLSQPSYHHLYGGRFANIDCWIDVINSQAFKIFAGVIDIDPVNIRAAMTWVLIIWGVRL